MHETPSTAKLALKWGLISGVATMLYSTLLYTTGLFNNPSASWVTIILAVVFITLAMREFRELNGGYLSYGEGVGLGTLTAAISGLLSATYGMIYTSFIDPTIMDQIIEANRERMEEQGQLSDEQIEAAMETMQAFQSPGITFFVGVLGAVLGGLLISLIVAAIMRRNRPVFE